MNVDAIVTVVLSSRFSEKSIEFDSCEFSFLK